MVITERDQLILRVCLEQKFMTLVQIGKMFFLKSENVFEVPMKKVRQLVNVGFLETIRLRVGEKRLYVITRKGVQLLRKKKLSSGLRALETVNDKTWEHDECVTDVRIVFETLLGFTEWIPERMLKKHNVRKKVPDALVNNGRQHFVIEVELHLKNKRYYEKVLLDMCLRYDKEIILYFMRDETKMKWLMNQAKRWERIYFMDLHDFERMTHGLQFKNASGKELYLERLHKGSVLFYDPEDPNQDITYIDDDYDGSEDDEEFDRWRREEEEDRKKGGSIGQGT